MVSSGQDNPLMKVLEKAYPSKTRVEVLPVLSANGISASQFRSKADVIRDFGSNPVELNCAFGREGQLV